MSTLRDARKGSLKDKHLAQESALIEAQIKAEQLEKVDAEQAAKLLKDKKEN